jgi:hypothetical protein
MKLNVECVYDDRKNRPGMRPGAIEALTQRVRMLEQMVLWQSLLLKPLILQGTSAPTAGVEAASPRNDNVNFADQTGRMREILLEAGDSSTPMPNMDLIAVPSIHACPGLPPLPDMLRMVDIYFEQIHRWIPMLHVPTFKAKAADIRNWHSISTVLHAIASICIRLDDRTYSQNLPGQAEECLRHRHVVMLRSMEHFSVESLQRL